VVEVQIEVIEAPAVAIDEPRPRANPGDVVAPGLRRRDLGRVREPERAGVCDAKPPHLEENRRQLPGPSAIITADANDRIARRRGQDFVNLKRESFLEPDKIGIALADQVEQHLPAGRPVVVAVLRGTVTNVEGHDLERVAQDWLRCGQAIGEEPCQDDKNRRAAVAPKCNRHEAAGTRRRRRFYDLNMRSSFVSGS